MSLSSRSPAHCRALRSLYTAGSALAAVVAFLPGSAAAQQAIYAVVPDTAPDPLLANLSIPADAARAGMWSGIVAWPIVAIHASLLPDGRILTLGAAPGGNAQDGRTLVFWNPRKGLGADAFQVLPNVQNVDSFCGTATLLSDGKLLTSGGASYSSGFSSRESMVVDWRTTASSRDHDLNAPRWYATMIKLPDGRALISGGGAPYANADPNRPDAANDISSTPEVYTPGQGWRSLIGAYSTDAFGAKNARWWYPRQWVSPSGTVFGISTEKMWEMRLDGNGAIRTIGDFKLAPAPNLRVNVGPTSTAVMYDTGKILQVGGNGYHNGYNSPSSAGATVIDINGLADNKVVVSETRGLYNARQWASSVVLPNGQVGVFGGSRYADWGGDNAVLPVETWNPASNAWTIGASAAVYRGYHSTAALLPDGVVLVAGGGIPGPVTNLNAQIYYPAYLFKSAGAGSTLAERPRIVSLSTNAGGYAQTIDVQTATGDDIAEVSLIAAASVTHGFDSNQRRMKLAFTRSAAGLKVTLPASPNLAPPGYYTLATVSTAGVPSAGTIVAIGAAPPPGSGQSAPKPSVPSPAPNLATVGATPTQIGGAIGTIAAASDGTLATANVHNQVWVSQMGAGWTMLPGQFVDAAPIANNRYYAIGTDKLVYRWNGSGWRAVGREAKAIAVASDGTVAVINATDNTIWVKSGDDETERWALVPGAFAKRLALVKRGSLYFVSNDNLVWRSNLVDAPTRIGANAIAVASTATGTTTVVGSDGAVWRKGSDDNVEAWTPLGVKAVTVATPDAARLVYADAAGNLFSR